MNELAPYAVVFSGGGALGAWEVGCLRSLLKKYGGRYPAVMTGASAGALNAAAVALGMSADELESIWVDLKPEDVYRSAPLGRSWRGLLMSVGARAVLRRSVLDAAASVAADLRALYDSTPLAATLDRLLRKRWDNLATFQGRVVFAVTNLSTNAKKYYYYPESATKPSARWRPITSFEVLRGALLASTAIPIIFPPYNDEVDGGVLHNQPLAAAHELLTPGNPIFVLMPQTDRLPTALDLAVLPSRLLETWMSQGFAYELSRLAILNIAATGLGKPPRPVCLIRAGQDLETLGSGLLKFGSRVRDLVRRGETDADSVLATFEDNDETTWPRELRISS